MNNINICQKGGILGQQRGFELGVVQRSVAANKVVLVLYR